MNSMELLRQLDDPPRYKKALLITKDNRLVRMHGVMTPLAYKLTNYILWLSMREGRLDNLKADYKDIVRALHIEGNRRGEVFKLECYKAAKTTIEIEDIDHPEDHWTVISLIEKIEYNHGVMTARINPDVIPYIKNLRGNFTPVELQVMNECTTYPSMRLYEVCLSWRRVGQVTYTAEEWKGLLGATKKTYSIFSQFRRRVWDPAINVVNEKTNLKIVPSYTKHGRNVTHITVRIQEVKTTDNYDEERFLLPSADHESSAQTTFAMDVKEPKDALQSRYEAAGATPAAVRMWRKMYPEEALWKLLDKMKQVNPQNPGAWLGAACKKGGWLMNAYMIEKQEELDRLEKARNTAYFVIPEIPTDAEPIPFDVSDALEKALVAVIKQHLQNGDLNVTSKRALIEHRMQPAEFAERYL